jgi:hypothetical protein
LFGLIRGDLILTLGMPLVSGLTQRELAGVVAHEFGHFTQHAGMRLSYLTRSVNGWFGRVVYERDGWDQWIEDWSSSATGWESLMVGCARLGVALSRSVLRLLMLTGQLVSAFLLRQMEYDADQHEVRLAGSAAFESTMLKFGALSAVLSEIHFEMRRTWRKQLQLPDNLPVLLEHRVSHLPPERRAKFENAAGLGATRWLDTHPSAGDRVRRARQAGEPGLDLSHEPAGDLFRNFDSVSRLVTMAHYEDDLNVPVTPDFLIPLETIIRGHAKTPESAPPAAPIVPMMRYDPSAFQGKGPKEP